MPSGRQHVVKPELTGAPCAYCGGKPAVGDTYCSRRCAERAHGIESTADDLPTSVARATIPAAPPLDIALPTTRSRFLLPQPEPGESDFEGRREQNRLAAQRARATRLMGPCARCGWVIDRPWVRGGVPRYCTTCRTTRSHHRKREAVHAADGVSSAVRPVHVA